MNYENVNDRLSQLEDTISCVCHANRTTGEVCPLFPIRFTTRANNPALTFNGNEQAI
ncbi:hypothetical protein [Paenibacillus albiflavus]|uniref:hypothetical protein n=1 Tax=Paenibacillus albiflavus TaxID=2545760 RepID=UPI001404E043|nr:hypothetical protein [Paenibacillus albiflavus]